MHLHSLLIKETQLQRGKMPDALWSKYYQVVYTKYSASDCD